MPDEQQLRQIPALDVDAAITNCGSFEAFLETLKTYYGTLFSGADKIERLLEEGDLKNYTIAVHALKSSSRLVGALSLSADALEMENAGNAGDKTLIAEKTPQLLAGYRALGEALSVLFPKQDEALLEDISADTLAGIVANITAAADDFDLDALDEAVAALEHYRFPAEQTAQIERVRECAAAADWSALEEAISALSNGI